MSKDSKVGRLILHLTKLTAEKQVEWTLCDPPRSLTAGTDSIISLYFEAEYKDQTLALFERRYRAYDIDTESSYWASDLYLGIVDEGRMVWEHSESSSALVNLFQVARESAANIDGIIDSLLG